MKKKEVLLISIEKYQRDWLAKEAKKKRLSLAAVIRYMIEYFINRK